MPNKFLLLAATMLLAGFLASRSQLALQPGLFPGPRTLPVFMLTPRVPRHLACCGCTKGPATSPI